jgi:serine protease Do
MKRIIFILLLCLGINLPVFGENHFDLEDAISKVAFDVGKTVVSISTVEKERIGVQFPQAPFNDSGDEGLRRFFEEFFGAFPDAEFKRIGLGSGVIIDKNGYILTNEHVVSGASEIKVKLADGREFDAKTQGVDKRSDLAVIKIKAVDLPVAKLGNSDNLKIGKWVVAIGNPFGFAIENPEPTVTVGVVSALHRYLPALGRRDRSYDELIQTDAAINPGNSGGPLVNLDGEVIGINTAIISLSGGYQGIGFAIPVNKAKKILTKLTKGEKIVYGWLGVSIQDLNDDLRGYFGIKESTGIIIVKVYANSPAEKSNLKEGDLILAFNNQPVNTSRDLIRMVSASEVSSQASVKILREAKEMNVNITIGKSPADLTNIEEEQGQSKRETFRGLAVEDISQEYKQRFKIKEPQGVVIVYIEDNSSADRTNLMVGDVIIKVNGKEIKNKQDFISTVSKIKGSWLLKTSRGFVVTKEK